MLRRVVGEPRLTRLLQVALRAVYGRYVPEPVKNSLRRRDQERGELTMLRLLASERRCVTDPEARRAATVGVVERAKHLSWYYRDRGRRMAATRTCLHAFRLVGRTELLLRALLVWGPQNPRRYFGRVLSARAEGLLLCYAVLSASLV